MIVMRAPWASPPLRSNDRMHWARKAKLTRAMRNDAATLAAAHPKRCPITWPVTVTMIWEVTDKRVRDAGSMAPSLKAFIDGLVDGGILSADRHEVVTEERLRIEVGNRKGVRVEITEVTP